MLYVHTESPINKWIISNIALEFGFPDYIGLALIPYYFSIRDFLNLRAINYNPW